MMILLAAVSLYASQAASSLPPRKAGETLQQFASRVIPKGERLDHVVQGDFGASRGNIVIFFDRTGNDGAFLEGWALVPQTGGGYRRYELAGDYVRHATVEAILFANADADSQKELVVLTSAPSEMLIEGRRIDVCYPYIFDQTPAGFTYLQARSEELDMGSARCTAAHVRRQLGRK